LVGDKFYASSRTHATLISSFRPLSDIHTETSNSLT